MSKPKDQSARDRIESVFDRNLLVEAGAGSGKTRSLARRMAAGIASGTYDIGRMAAVTFTRKAAAELRGRFQLALEERVVVARTLRSAGTSDEVARLEHALSNIERFYAGTIHAFCAHLLRERPVESGIAPGFTELDEAEDVQRRKEAWRDYISYARANGKKELLDLLAAGVKASHLDHAFSTMCLYEEVTFPAAVVPRPDLEKPWKAVRKFGAALAKLIPETPHPDAKCGALPKADEFVCRLKFADPSLATDLVALLEIWDNQTGITKKWWDGNGYDAEALIEAFRADVVHPFLTGWREYLYHLCVTVLTDAREFARADRLRRNALNYGDLLQMAAKVLRGNPSVRHALQQKYRWLFVDEFQDTDPVQAEIIVLLAEEDEPPLTTGHRPLATSPSDWTSAKLRPGALFVVGDPKQSIYRFRRADIDIYTRVKHLILDSGGEVVPLTTNFRSLPSICSFANDVFDGPFPKLETVHSPKFEPLVAFRRDERGGSGSAPDEGVRTLPVPATVDQKEVSATEAQAIARYIRTEVDAGRRKCGDFLILTKKKKPLATYTAALEDLQIPTEVTGAGAFGNSDEVRHLSLLLRALADPQDTVTLVGVLRGPFFGVSDQELFDYVKAGNRLWLFAGTENQNQPAEPPGSTDRQNHPSEPTGVVAALASLRRMYRWTRILPPAAAVDRILDSTGCLAQAACTPSAAEAGNLLHAIDRIRQISEDGGTLMDAVESLEEDSEGATEIDSLPLEPGRGDVVRLMNLHKAKGLEAPVVFLADPCGAYPLNVDVRIVRNGPTAEGYFQLREKKENSRKDRIVAQPQGWAAHEIAEHAYLVAEEDRLLYVAATRAQDLLVVGRWLKTGGRKRAWEAFDKWLTKAPALTVPEKVAVKAPVLPDVSEPALSAADASRTERVSAATTPSWSVTSVTAEARHIAAVVRKAEGASDDPSRTVTQDTPAHRADAGMAWGTLIHGLLEYAMQQPKATVQDLRRLAMWLTVEQPELRSVIDRAIETVQQVSRASFWQEAKASPEHHVETPFATAHRRDVLAGVIDLVFRGAPHWQIVDYKTDRSMGSATLLKYAAQLEQYGIAWQAITGEKPTVKRWEITSVVTGSGS